MFENEKDNKTVEDLLRGVLGKLERLLQDSKEMDKKIAEDDELTEALKSLGCNTQKELDAARFVINPIITTMCDCIDDLPNLADIINNSQKKELYDLFGNRLTELVKIGLEVGIKYSEDKIKEISTLSEAETKKVVPGECYAFDKNIHSTPEEFLDECLSDSRIELDKFLDSKGIDKENVVALGVRTIRDSENGEVEDVKVYNVYSGEEVEWETLDKKLREALVREMKANGENDIARILDEKDNKEEDDDNKIGITKDEFFDFFSDLLRGMDGER